jgi:pimeloyl-ACP methyl ester carboxylesterase
VQFNVRINNAEIPVRVKGNTLNQKIIIYVNGGPGLTALDDAQLDRSNFGQIESNYAIAYYDQRGTGNSQGTIKEGELTLSQYSKDLDAIISVVKAQFQDPKIFVMGHSFGGLISANYLLDTARTNTIDGWINMDGTMATSENTIWQYRHTFLVNIANEEIASGNNVSHWQDALNWATNNPEITTEQQKMEWRNFIGAPGGIIIPSENSEIKAGESLGLIFNSSYNPFPAFWSRNQKITNEALLDNAKNINLLPILSNLKLPCLFLWGRYDDVIPPELGQEALNEMGTPEVDKYIELYYNSAHQPFVNDHVALTQDVVDFVAKY